MFINKISLKVFYCEQRKKVIPVLYEAFCIPWWMNMLIGSSTFEVYSYSILCIQYS